LTVGRERFIRNIHRYCSLWFALCAVLISSSRIAVGQPATQLTLERARQIALKNHPRLGSANLYAQAAEKRVAEARSAYYPVLRGNVTGAGAESGTAVAAGNVTTSALSTRLASGVALDQLVTDFGRTSKLAASARSEAQAQSSDANATRAEILLEVSDAYYAVLGAESVLRSAEADLDNRRLLLRQVQALAQSALRGTLDVTFAQVAVSETELAVSRAQSDLKASQARLSAAMGADRDQAFQLVDQQLPPNLTSDPKGLVDEALRSRPDLASSRFSRDAARDFQKAERRLRYPSVNLIGVAGVIPEHDRALHGDYGAAAVNVSIPVFNGGLFAARNAEAELRAQAAEKDVQDLSIRITRDVRIAWLTAQDAFRRLDVTSRLVEQANQALRLAKARYDIGLGGIVELNQAQTTQTNAQLEAARAKYEYLSRRAELDYATGVLR
jgi:outer membrane protein